LIERVARDVDPPNGIGRRMYRRHLEDINVRGLLGIASRVAWDTNPSSNEVLLLIRVFGFSSEDSILDTWASTFLSLISFCLSL
jgi:hypothetical protein